MWPLNFPITYSANLWHTCRLCESDPPENCHLTVKKLPKTCHFFPKNAKNFHFFQKNCHCHWQFFWKKWKFLAFFGKKCQVFGNFLTVKWQFSGGSGLEVINIVYYECLYSVIKTIVSLSTGSSYVSLILDDMGVHRWQWA